MANDYSPIGPVPSGIANGTVDATSRKLARDMRGKAYGKDVRETMARMTEWHSIRSSAAEVLAGQSAASAKISEVSAKQSAQNVTKNAQNAIKLLNEGIRDITAEYASLKPQAISAIAKAGAADALSKSVQSQFNQVVIEGDSSVEAAQARVDASGHTNATLKERLDKEYNEVTAQLEQNVYNIDLFKKRPDDINDTERLQRAVDYAHSLNRPLVLNGELYYVTSLEIPAGFKLYGNGATFKKPDLSKPPYNYTVEQMKWVYILQLIDYSGDLDSEQTIIDGISFDGNCWSMWDVANHDQEQASIIFAYGDRTRPGRLSLKISNCDFRDNVSDGIHLWHNVNAQIDNCSSTDCFRGGVTVTGGYSKINISNFTSNSVLTPDGIDIEVDMLGYGDTYAIELNIDGLIIDSDLDVHIPRDSVANLNNIIMSEEKGTFNLGVNRNSTLNISNSTIVGVNDSPSNINRLSLVGKATFHNCDFLLRGRDGAPDTDKALYILFGQKETRKGKDAVAVFNNCRFKYIGLNADTLKKQGVNASPNDKGGTLKFINCYFDNTLHTAVAAQASHIEFINVDIDTRVTGLAWSSHNLYNPWSTVVFDGVNVLNDEVNYFVMHGNNCTITNRNMFLNENNNKISGSFFSYNENVNNYIKHRGQRNIYVTHDPNLQPYVKGMVGDIAFHETEFVNDVPKKWICTRYQRVGGSWNTEWKEITEIVEA